MLKRLYLFLILFLGSWYGLYFWFFVVTIESLEMLVAPGALFIWFMTAPRHATPIPILAGFLLIFMGISLAMSPHTTTLGILFGFADIVKLAMALLAFMLMGRLVQDLPTFRKAWRWMCWGALINGGVGLTAYVLSFAAPVPFVIGGGARARVYGLHSDPTRFGCLMALVGAATAGTLLAGTKRGFRAVGATVLLAVATFVSGSRGPVLALIAGIVLGSLMLRLFAFTKLITSGKGVAYFLAALALVFAVSHFFPESLEPAMYRLIRTFTPNPREGEAIGEDPRVYKVQASLPVVADHLILGTGPGTWGQAVAGHAVASAHNTYLTYLVELGPIGLLVYLSMVSWLYVQTLRMVRRLRWLPDPEAQELRGMGVGLVLGMTALLLNMLTIEFSFMAYVWMFFGLVGAFINIAKDTLAAPVVQPAEGEFLYEQHAGACAG